MNKILFPSQEKMLQHPGVLLGEYLEQKELTQKAFSLMIGKRVSEINELIKGKRNITIARDLLFAEAFGTPYKFWVSKQLDYDYEQALNTQEKKLNEVEDQISPFLEEGTEKTGDKELVVGEGKKNPPQVQEEFSITKVFEDF